MSETGPSQRQHLVVAFGVAALVSAVATAAAYLVEGVLYRRTGTTKDWLVMFFVPSSFMAVLLCLASLIARPSRRWGAIGILILVLSGSIKFFFMGLIVVAGWIGTLLRRMIHF